MPNLIFISYRRTDNPFAGRIRDRLVTAFGEAHVFKDSYSIGYGDDFPEKIKSALDQCDVMLVIISSTWLTATESTKDRSVIRRLDNPDDWVRREITFALDRGDVRIIPVLVQKATMPLQDELPDVLRKLSNKNAVEIHDDPYFDRDINELIRVLQIASPTGSSRRGFTVGAGLTVAIAILAIVGFIIFAPRLFSISSPTPTSNVTATPLAPTDTNASVPTIYIPPPGTATEVFQLDITATEIMLQRTVDAKKTVNAQLFEKSTHIMETANAVPTVTATPTLTNTPTASATLTVTPTPVPPTKTPTSQPTATPIPPTLTTTVTPSPTNTLQPSSNTTGAVGYPCAATIVDNTGNATILNQVHSEPIYASAPISSVRVGQAVSVLKKEMEGSRTVWYQIGNDQGKAIGYLLEDYVRLSPSCPQ